MNLDVDWESKIEVMVTKEMCEWVTEAALGFEIWVGDGGELGEVKDKGKDVGGEDEVGGGGDEEDGEDEVKKLRKENVELKERLAEALRVIERLKGGRGVEAAREIDGIVNDAGS